MKDTKQTCEPGSSPGFAALVGQQNGELREANEVFIGRKMGMSAEIVRLVRTLQYLETY